MMINQLQGDLCTLSSARRHPLTCRAACTGSTTMTRSISGSFRIEESPCSPYVTHADEAYLKDFRVMQLQGTEDEISVLIPKGIKRTSIMITCFSENSCADVWLLLQTVLRLTRFAFSAKIFEYTSFEKIPVPTRADLMVILVALALRRAGTILLYSYARI